MLLRSPISHPISTAVEQGIGRLNEDKPGGMFANGMTSDGGLDKASPCGDILTWFGSVRLNISVTFWRRAENFVVAGGG